MSKFKIGDKVMLSPNSRWVNYTSYKSDSANPLNVVGVIDEADIYHHMEYGIMWDNGKHNSCYTDKDLILVSEQPQEECPYAVIEELEAYNESLEETLISLTKEVIVLRENQITESHKQQIECYYAMQSALSNYKYYEESEDTYSQDLLMNIRKLQNVHTALMAVMNGGK